MILHLSNFIKKYFGFFCFLILIVYTVLFNHTSFYYDEPYYLYNVQLLNKMGLTNEFILVMNGPAGPLHSLFFWLLQPLTGNTVLGVRLVNIGLLFFIIVITMKTYKHLYPEKILISNWALRLMSIPMVYVCAGMALTEMPALFMLSLSLYFLFKADVNVYDYKWILAAFFLSLSILGRQPYVLLLLPFAGWFWYNTINKKNWVPLLIFIVLVMLLPFYAFSIWKSVAPLRGGDIANKELFNISNLFLGLGYSFLVTIILNRAFILPIRKSYVKYIVTGFIVVFMLCYFLHFRQPLMMTIASKIIPAHLYNLYQVLIASILVLTGLFFLISIVNQVRINYNRPAIVFLLVCLFLVVISCTKITHQFSSRYVFQAAVFFTLLIPPAKKDNLQFLLSVMGAFLGMLSLYSYKF